MRQEQFGRESRWLYVNSADNRARGLLEDDLGFDEKGRIEINRLHQMIGKQEAVQIDHVIFGSVAMRKHIENAGARVRINGKPYGKRQANKLMRQTDFIQIVSVSSGFDLPWTLMSSLDAFVEQQAEAGRCVHRKARNKSVKVDVLDEY